MLDKVGQGVSNQERETMYHTLGVIAENLIAICNAYATIKS